MTPAPNPAEPGPVSRADILIEALPYMQRYAGQTFVVKYGGHAMGDPALAASFAQDVVLLKAIGINPVVVHGGGPQIGSMLKKLGVQSEFVNGLRVTDAETATVAEMVLSGTINKEIVTWINQAGGRAVGISGKDGKLVRAEKLEHVTYDADRDEETIVDLGFVGAPVSVDTTLIDHLEIAGMIPVVAPIGVDDKGETYNINADTMAGALAAGLGAARLFLLTDVAGVLDKSGQLLTDIGPDQVRRLREDGTISGGMIPKLETCLHAVANGVDAAVILDGRVPHAVLLEMFTDRGVGTLVRA
ncbi:acetylglutamate kinase [Sphingomonas changnyeongensis]|uniref:Acetylglutamate kinase n=1 Tax=Sphingomonas changnyeongensis TaxID=2698679 RepID=A0A7Z2NV27_9SPHN|nr:acetylglutamate kinase [Sphingomonas changnyeongensis]QHL90262.1 acetylglutamate kinase [Sphingomonas changnyeongensis]